MKHTFKALAIASVLALLAGTSVFAADTTRVMAKIPFSFRAGNESLPAGEYTFTPEVLQNPRLLTVQSEKGTKHEFLLGEVRGLSKTSDTSKIVFEEIGGEHYLSQVWVAGMDVVEVVSQRTINREVERGAEGRQTVDVPAHKMPVQR